MIRYIDSKQEISYLNADKQYFTTKCTMSENKTKQPNQRQKNQRKRHVPRLHLGPQKKEILMIIPALIAM
jgi:hypothetical protein